MSQLRAIIVDDEPLILDGLKRVFESDGWVAVVGQARTLADALVLLEQHRPDIIILDLRLPDSRDEATVRAVRARAPKACIIAITSALDAHSGVVSESGANALLQKHEASDRIMELILELCRVPRTGSDMTRMLTEREEQVVRLVGEALSRAEIAERLFVSENTVKTHLSHIFRKLGVRNRVQLVRKHSTGGPPKPGA